MTKLNYLYKTHSIHNRSLGLGIIIVIQVLDWLGIEVLWIGLVHKQTLVGSVFRKLKVLLSRDGVLEALVCTAADASILIISDR